MLILLTECVELELDLWQLQNYPFLPLVGGVKEKYTVIYIYIYIYIYKAVLCIIKIASLCLAFF